MSVTDTDRRRHLLRGLNLFGLDHLDPVILAALADGQPLLLIGDHGTAKSELLNRLASALSLTHRHYNASLISFDDLLGYPVPNAQRSGLEYLRTPGDLWKAESVCLDEISRCRPEHQNKLFSIIHERRIQGLPLEKLRYRWSAMNPPISLDGEEEGGESYQGSLPLDTALADRFVYIATVPAFTDLSHADRERVITQGGETPGGDAGLPVLVEKTRQAQAVQNPGEAGWVADYVNALVVPLRDAELAISGRRAVVLARSSSMINVACQVLGRNETLPDAAFLALKWGLPQRAQGRRIRESKLIAVHREAPRIAGKPRSGLWQRLREERDPVRRVALALFCSEEPPGRIELSQLVTDASVTYGELFELLSRTLQEADGEGGGEDALLGNHDQDGGDGGEADPEMLREIRDIVARWPMFDRRSGRDYGGTLARERLRLVRARRAAVGVIRRALWPLLDLAAGGGGIPQRSDAWTDTVLPFRSGMDRRAELKTLLGEEPLLFRARVRAPGIERQQRVHVYVDVSGSMEGEHTARLARRGARVNSVITRGGDGSFAAAFKGRVSHLPELT